MMDEESIFLNLKKIMASLLDLDLAEVNEMSTTESKLRDDLGIDSVESLDFLTEIENKYSIHISDEEGPLLVTVADVIKLIQSRAK